MEIGKKGCICPRCQFYTEKNRQNNETFFCENKKNECPMDSQNKCICLECLLYKGYKLTGSNFCIDEK